MINRSLVELVETVVSWWQHRKCYLYYS